METLIKSPQPSSAETLTPITLDESKRLIELEKIIQTSARRR